MVACQPISESKLLQFADTQGVPPVLLAGMHINEQVRTAGT